MGSKRADEIVAGIKAKKRGTPQSPKIPQAAMAEPDKNAPAAKPPKVERPKEPRAPSHSQLLRMVAGQESQADARLPLEPADVEEKPAGLAPGLELSARVQQLEEGNQELRGMVKALARQVVQLEGKIETRWVKTEVTKPTKARDGTVVDCEEDWEQVDDKDIIFVPDEQPELRLEDLAKKHPKVGTTVQSVAPIVSENALAIFEASSKEKEFVSRSDIQKLVNKLTADFRRIAADVFQSFGEKLKIEIAKIVGEK